MITAIVLLVGTALAFAVAISLSVSDERSSRLRRNRKIFRNVDVAEILAIRNWR